VQSFKLLTNGATGATGAADSNFKARNFKAQDSIWLVLKTSPQILKIYSVFFGVSHHC
jgi:hypothetical protein